MVIPIRVKHLAMRLSRLSNDSQKRPELEQYSTQGEVAARWLRSMCDRGDLEGARVVDLGSGNGILGIGAMLLGSSHVTMIEVDPDAATQSIVAAQRISEETGSSFEVMIDEIGAKWPSGLNADVVIMNPPWGFQTPGADRAFIECALSGPARIIHLLHSAAASHPGAMAMEAGWTVERSDDFEFKLPPTMAHHKSRSSHTKATTWRFER